MSIREGPGRRVAFDIREELEHDIDKLVVMIGKLAAKDSKRNRHFKPQIHKSRRPPPPSQNRGYSQISYQNMNRVTYRLNSTDKGQFWQDRGQPRFEQSYRGSSFWDNSRGYGGQNSRG